MVKLTEEMKEMIKTQLGYVATVRADGVPNIGPKRSARIFDDSTLIFNENTGKEIYKNLKEGSKIAIAFVDWANLLGYRFVGTAEVHESGKIFDDSVEWAKGKVPKAAVLIKIEEIYDLKIGNAGVRLA